MEEILLANGLPKETIAAIMMLYKNTKVKFHSPDGDRLLQHCSRCAIRRHISPLPVYHLPRVHILYINRFNERKWFQAGKGKKQRYPIQTITDADYADDIVLLANTPTQAKTLLHSLE